MWSPKLTGLILWGPRMSAQHFIVIHPGVVEIFQFLLLLLQLPSRLNKQTCRPELFIYLYEYFVVVICLNSPWISTWQSRLLFNLQSKGAITTSDHIPCCWATQNFFHRDNPSENLAYQWFLVTLVLNNLTHWTKQSQFKFLLPAISGAFNYTTWSSSTCVFALVCCHRDGSVADHSIL